MGSAFLDLVKVIDHPLQSQAANMTIGPFGCVTGGFSHADGAPSLVL